MVGVLMAGVLVVGVPMTGILDRGSGQSLSLWYTKERSVSASPKWRETPCHVSRSKVLIPRSCHSYDGRDNAPVERLDEEWGIAKRCTELRCPNLTPFL